MMGELSSSVEAFRDPDLLTVDFDGSMTWMNSGAEACLVDGDGSCSD